jgi:hypothetical protein
MARGDREGPAGAATGYGLAGPASFAGWSGVLAVAAASLGTGLRRLRGRTWATRAGFKTGRPLGRAAPQARVAATRRTVALGSSWHRTTRRLALAFGFAAGYLLGARAGEARYRQLAGHASQLIQRLTGASRAVAGAGGAAPRQADTPFVPPAPRLESDATATEPATSPVAPGPIGDAARAGRGMSPVPGPRQEEAADD